MSLFPNGLTREEWDGLNYRLQNGEPNLADHWAVREADLIKIGALTGPESHGLIGWTRRQWTYHYHVQDHIPQIVAGTNLGLRYNFLSPTDSSPKGAAEFEALYFRDADGKSAPVDATGMQGWALYTGEVRAHAAFVSGVTGVNTIVPPKLGEAQDDGGVVEVPSPTGNLTTTASPQLVNVPTTTFATVSPPAHQWKVGDEVVYEDCHLAVQAVMRTTRGTYGRLAPPGMEQMPEQPWLPLDGLPRVLKDGA